MLKYLTDRKLCIGIQREILVLLFSAISKMNFGHYHFSNVCYHKFVKFVLLFHMICA